MSFLFFFACRVRVDRRSYCWNCCRINNICDSIMYYVLLCLLLLLVDRGIRKFEWTGPEFILKNKFVCRISTQVKHDILFATNLPH